MPWDDGIIVGLADGLGHSPRAGGAAKAFLDRIRKVTNSLPIDLIFANAHRSLTRTPGTVAAIARIDAVRGRAEIGMVGTIAARVVRGEAGRTTHFQAAPGVLGGVYEPVRPQSFEMSVGDLLIMHSDGVDTHFELGEARSLSAQNVAEYIVRTSGRPNDDAACVVVRVTPREDVRSLSPSSEKELPPRVLAIKQAADPACVATETRTYAARVGLPLRAQWEAAIVVSELATNALKFGVEGVLTLKHVRTPRAALVIEVADKGKGIPDVGAAMRDGWSEGDFLSVDRPRTEGQGLGVGLGTVRRLSDELSIDSGPDRGTRITVWKYLPK
ncbi:MAG TPA: ATP-binding protein [Labilithrix sp.]|nr:ATP-binding protein [Labilithrix sp.]